MVPEPSEPSEAAPPVEAGAEGGAEVPAVSSGAAVSEPVGVPEGWGGVGESVGVTSGDGRPVRGSGACGRSLSGVWGNRKSPAPSPATASTEPTAFCAERTRRRSRIPVLRRFRCAGSKGVCSSASRIIRANSRSK